MNAILLMIGEDNVKKEVLDSFLKICPDVKKVKICTTKATETKDAADDYYFISKTTFYAMHSDDTFVSARESDGNCYGMLKSSFCKTQDTDVIASVTIEEAKKIKSMRRDAIIILVLKTPFDENQQQSGIIKEVLDFSLRHAVYQILFSDPKDSAEQIKYIMLSGLS